MIPSPRTPKYKEVMFQKGYNNYHERKRQAYYIKRGLADNEMLENNKKLEIEWRFLLDILTELKLDTEFLKLL